LFFAKQSTDHRSALAVNTAMFSSDNEPFPILGENMFLGSGKDSIAPKRSRKGIPS